jgi:hypothetical protein
VAIMAGVYGLANTVDMPTRQAYVAEMVGKGVAAQRHRAQLGDVQQARAWSARRWRPRHRRAGARGGLLLSTACRSSPSSPP